MTFNHKHKGIYDSKDNLRMHPKNRVHKDKDVKLQHNLTIAREKRWSNKNAPKPKKTVCKKTVARKVPRTKVSKSHVKKKQTKKTRTEKATERIVSIPVDNKGYIYVELSEHNVKGIKIKFQRKEGRKKRTVGLQIENI